MLFTIMNAINLCLFISIFFTWTEGLRLVDPSSDKKLFRTEAGVVRFTSDAPLELIEAQSQSLRGVLDSGTGKFAFAVSIASFQGFNSPLQQEHFNENYLESDEFPNATFQGRVIEELDFRNELSFEVRAKGLLQIHGITQERILKISLQGDQEELKVKASFTIPLDDHDIKIPKIVYQKIAEEIQVNLEATLTSEDS